MLAREHWEHAGTFAEKAFVNLIANCNYLT